MPNTFKFALRRARALTLGLALALTALPSFAQTWTATPDIPGPPQNIFMVSPVVDSAGVVTTSWQATDGGQTVIRASRYIGGSWSAYETLPTPGANNYSLMTAPYGDGVIALWTRIIGGRPQILSARFSSATGWSAIQELTPQGEYPVDIQLAWSRTGTILVTWLDGSMKATNYVDGAWTAPQAISPAGGNGRRVVIDSSGAATMTWSLGTGVNARVSAARFVGGVWGPAVSISSSPGASFPKIAVDSAGEVTVVWEARPVGQQRYIEAARFANGVWHPAEALSGQTGENPMVGASGAGTAHVIWQQSSGGGARALVGRDYVGGSWTAVRDFPPAVTTATATQIIGNGSNVALALVYVQSGSDLHPHVLRYAYGSWSPPAYVPGAATSTFGMTLDSDSVSTFVWAGSDGVIRASRLAAPVPAPVPTLSEWAMILLGLTLAVSAALAIQRRRLEA